MASFERPYLLPRFASEDEAQRVYLNGVLQDIDARILALVAAGSPLTTKGDIWVFSTTNTRLPIGTNGWVLTADTGASTGMSWQAVSSGPTGPAGGDLTGSYPNPTLNIHGSTAKVTIVGADEFVLADSAAAFATKKVTFTNLVSSIGSTITFPVTSVFSRTGAVVATLGDYTFSLITGLDSLSAKTTPVAADELLLADSASSFGNKKITFANLQTTILAGVSTAPDFVIYTLSGGSL